MSDQAIRSADKPFPARAGLAWLTGAGIYVLALAVGPSLLNDADSFTHVAIGRWIITHATVPVTDPFSFSMHGAHWIAFEWLSEVIYAGVFAAAGWPGVVVVATAAIALAFALLTRFLLRALAPAPALLMVLAAILLSEPHMLARPHVLTLPIMVIWAAALVRAMDERRGPPYWALPLLVLWANLHGSVVLAIGLIGPAVLEALLEEKRSAWPCILWQWIPFGALAVATACITPYGPGQLLIPLTTLGLGHALHAIVEWRPQNFSHFGAFELMLLLGIFGLSRGVKLPLVRVLVLLGLLHFALAQVRNADLLAMLAPIYLAAPLARQLKTERDEEAAASASAIRLAAAFVIAVTTVLALMRPVYPDVKKAPRAAIAATDLRHAGPVLNDYQFGGYLIFVGIPVFVDSRGELYGGKFILRVYRDLNLVDLPDFLKLLNQYKIRATLLAPGTPAVKLLDRLPDWQRVYSDGVAVVHKRLPPAPQ
jgi:hypothetical protein